jgi:hypothetical protein
MPSIADHFDLVDRCMFLDNFQMIRRGGIGMLEGLGGRQVKKADPEELKMLDKVDWEPALRSSNRWFDRVTAALSLKDRAERAKELDKIGDDLKALKEEVTQPEVFAKLRLGTKPPDRMAGKAIGDILISLMMPAFNKVQDARDRAEQVRRNLHIAFGLTAYRREHGRYPARLNELAPKYLATIPGDLFSGKALFYQSADDGYLLYSVGRNGKDEGGRRQDDNPPGDDLRVRMPLQESKLQK